MHGSSSAHSKSDSLPANPASSQAFTLSHFHRLSTFLEEPSSRALSLISSSIQGIDLYFNRSKLLRIGQPGYAAAAPLMPQMAYPPSPSVLPAAAGFNGYTAGATSFAPLPVKPPGPNVFQKFTDRVSELGLSMPDLYNRYDVDRKGQLTQMQVCVCVYGGGTPWRPGTYHRVTITR